MQLDRIFISTIRPKLKNSDFSGSRINSFSHFAFLLIRSNFMED